MRHIKKYIFIGLILLVTGCTAEYNLTISNDKLEEDFTSMIYISEFPHPNPLYPDISLDDQLTPFIEQDQYPFFNNFDITYQKENIEEDDYRAVNYKYVYTKEEFKNSRVLQLCFEKHKYEFKDNYKFNLSGKFYCLYNDELIINVITNNKVISSNADEVNNNKYTWHITRDNVDNVDIKIEIARHDLKKIVNKYYKFIIIGIIMIVSILIGLIILLKSKKANKL